MSFTRFLAVARKEVVQILRDSRSLIIVVIMPVILVLCSVTVSISISKDCPFMCTTATAASRARTY